MPAYVTGPPDQIDTLVTDTGDFLVTDNLDQLVAPTGFFAGAQLVDLTIGQKQIVSAYVGASLVYLYDPVQVVTMFSGTDQDLLTVLNAAGVNPAKPVIVNFTDGQILGGVAAESLTLIGLGAYTNITINLDGQWQGRAGVNVNGATEGAIRSDQNLIIDNGGVIAGVVSDVPGGTQSNVIIVISATGKILAAGGNGGIGGNGGNGDNVTGWSGEQHSGFSPYYEWSKRSTGGIAYNCTSPKYCIAGPSATTANQLYYRGGSNYYKRGALTGFVDIHAVSRGLYVGGISGSGGAPGNGAGYAQPRTGGAPGGTGTNRAGDGGVGGSGGDWGVDGEEGGIGKSGLYYSPYSSTNLRTGARGNKGTSAGYSIVTTGTVIYQ